MSPRYITMKLPRTSGNRAAKPNDRDDIYSDEAAENVHADAPGQAKAQVAAQDIHAGESLE